MSKRLKNVYGELIVETVVNKYLKGEMLKDIVSYVNENIPGHRPLNSSDVSYIAHRMGCPRRLFKKTKGKRGPKTAHVSTAVVVGSKGLGTLDEFQSILNSNLSEASKIKVLKMLSQGL